MIPNNQVLNYFHPQQRLGNKTLFNNNVQKDNNIQTRYFSGIDAEIYFGEFYIDEAVQIQFSLQQNTMPLFGYNSYVYDQIAQGSRIIQGQFTVNFTKASYLYDVLNTLADITSGSSMNVNMDKENTINEMSQDSSVKSTKITINDRDPMWNKGFEICFSYGDGKSNVLNSTILLLKGVYLTGVSQQFGISGEPIYETYSFIARDLNFVPTYNKSESTNPQDKSNIEIEDAIIMTKARYEEKTNSNNGSTYGMININYETNNVLVHKVLFEPKLNLSSNRGFYEVYNRSENKRIDGDISFGLFDSWRKAIKNLEKQYASNASVEFEGILIFEYSRNESPDIINKTEKSVKIRIT